jgi:hypothetical protein
MFEEVKLCDLDKQVWQKFSPEVCSGFGRLVVETVRRAIPTLPKDILGRLVPSPPQGVAIDDLHLEQRTYNCLRRLFLEGRLTKVAEIGQMTIGDLLRIEGFGAKCLVDLLTSLESPHLPRNGDELQPNHEHGALQGEEDDSLRLLFSRIRHMRLPKLPEGAAVGALALSKRTYNCLENHGYFECPHALEELTVEQALEIPGFGIQSLMDFLAAIERYRQEADPGERIQAQTDDEVPLPLVPKTLFGNAPPGNSCFEPSVINARPQKALGGA